MMKACIFDLDGTLADTLESIAYSANRALEYVGLKPNPVENYKYYAGDGAAKMLERSLIDAGDTKLVHLEQVKEKYKELFAVDCSYNVKPFDGIVEMLDKLKTNNVKIAVLSNKPHDRTIDVVESLFGRGYFDKIYGQRENVEIKPSPEGALIIAKELNMSPQQCVYVGDTNTDMQTGKSANMLTVGVLWGFRDREELEENKADVIIETPMELIKEFI